DLAEVLLAELLKQRHLAGEPLKAVADAVGEAGRAEAAVAAGGRPARRLRLDEHHVELGVALPGEQRGPQAGETAADDRQVRAPPARQGGERIGRVRLVKPEGAGHRPCQGPGDGRGYVVARHRWLI